MNRAGFGRGFFSGERVNSARPMRPVRARLRRAIDYPAMRAALADLDRKAERERIRRREARQHD